MLYTTKLKLEPKVEERVIKSIDRISLLLSIENDYEIYLVGGCVRDMLRGKTPHDFDFCTNATPEQVKEAVNKHYKNQGGSMSVWDSGIKHGTVTVTDSFYGTSFEITTYRVDGKYSDGRRPDSIEFTPSLEEDLKRRDFTINAIAYDIIAEEVVTLDQSFLLDVQLGLIKCVGKADDRFKEDALRMMRAIRFSAQLNYTIDYDTFNAIVENAPLIQQISKERIRDELTKTLCSDNPQHLAMLVLTGLSYFIMPDLDKMLDCKQKNKYHRNDVLHHTLDVVKAVPADFVLRWSALFHDMGKPYCVTVDDEGYEHFYDHAEISSDKAIAYMLELKFDNDSINKITTLVKYHDAELGDIRMNTFKKLIIKIGEDMFDKYLLLRQADAMAHNMMASVKQAIKNLSVAKERYKKIIADKDAMTLSKLAIDGRDLLALGFIGKDIGAKLNACLEHVLEYPEDNTKDILIALVKQ